MSSDRPTSEPKTPIGGLFLRSWWLVIGNFGLIFGAVVIARDAASDWFGPRDGLFGMFVLSLFAARYIDIAHFKGDTADGDPANMGHFRRYAMGLAGTTLALWLAAHAVSMSIANKL